MTHWYLPLMNKDESESSGTIERLSPSVCLLCTVPYSVSGNVLKWHVFQEELQLMAEHWLVHHGHSPGAVWQDQCVRHGPSGFLQVWADYLQCKTGHVAGWFLFKSLVCTLIRSNLQDKRVLKMMLLFDAVFHSKLMDWLPMNHIESRIIRTICTMTIYCQI